MSTKSLDLKISIGAIKIVFEVNSLKIRKATDIKGEKIKVYDLSDDDYNIVVRSIYSNKNK